MKYYVGLLILLISTAAFSQATKDSLLIKRDVLISKAHQLGLSEIEKRELTKIAFDIQNRGFLLAERKHEYLNGLTYIDNAVPIWQTLGNISMEANLYKLKGPLLGRLNRFDEGHEYINKALKLYKMINQESGIAVTYFDLAQLFNIENKIDSAQHYVDLALNFWTREKDTSRIIGLYLSLIHI